MQIDRGDRISPPPPSRRSPLSIGAVAAVAAAVALALILLPDLRDYLRREAYSAARLAGVETPPDEFAPVYARLGLAPLRPGLAAAPKLSAALAKLLREPCDKRAAAALGDALIVEGEDRLAALALRGFAAACPDSAFEELRAGELLLRLGDMASVIAIADALIARQPAIADFRYLRARALARAKRHEEAVADFATAIALFHDRGAVHERVFVEMADAYVALGKPCEAAFALLSWVALDPARRGTPGARKRVEEYLALGCRDPAAAAQLDRL